jgi:hypothetical protein
MTIRRSTVASVAIREHPSHLAVFVVDPEGRHWFHSSFSNSPDGWKSAERLRGKLTRQGTARVTNLERTTES